MFQEFHTKKGISQIEDGVEYYDVSGDGGYHIDAVVDDRCTKCGSKKHSTDSCQVDISKLKCFRCQEFGHIGVNCPKNRGEKGKNKKGSVKGVQKGDRFEKGKSKGKGKKGKPGKGYGKKGKLNEVSWNEEEDSWWYQDEWSYNEQDWSWNVDQVGWESDQYGHDWSWNEEQSCGENSTWNEAYENEGSEKKKGDGASPTVGSLTLHAVFREFSEENDVLGNEQHVGALCLQPFLPSPQPFVAGAASGSQVVEGSEPGSDVCYLSGVRSEPSCLGFTSGPLCLGESSHVDVDHVNFHEGLLCDAPRKIQIFRLDERSRLQSMHDTVSFSHEFMKHATVVCPLLSELSISSDATWWLLDSGAAVTVLSDVHFPLFGTQIHSSPDSGKFRAANGSSVSMKGVSNITLEFQMRDSTTGDVSWRKATMQVMVGQTHHNILSTTALAESGWVFTQWRTGCEVAHEETGQTMCETVFHSGCPWVRMYPSDQSNNSSEDPSLHVSQTCLKRGGDFPVQPLSPALEAQLEVHRRQGHFPHHPACTECARGRGVFSHRRRKKESVECEIQADFCFLSRESEIVEDDDAPGRNMKILVMTEMLSGCVAFIIVTDRKEQVQSQICQWLDTFGLMSNQTSIILHTDDERAVSELVGRSSKHYLFQVRRAAPQQHRSVGGAERSVRKVKEALSVLRADLNKQGYDVRFSFEGFRDCLTYLSLMHNHFGRSGGTNLSPLETSAGRSLSKPTVSAFGSMVIAEIPDSIRQYSPNETRSVEAAYVHPGLGTGAAVEGMLRIEGQLQLRRFYARNIREVTPLTWKPELCGSLLYPLEASDVLPPVLDKQPSHVVPDGPENSPPRVLGNPEEYTFEDMEREYGLAEPSSAGYSPTLGSDSAHDDGDDEEYVPKRRSARSRPVKRPNADVGKSEVDKSRKVEREVFHTWM